MKMNKSETVKLLKMFKVVYDTFYIAEEEKELDIQINVWYSVFKDIDFKIIQQGAAYLFKTLRYNPKPADLWDSIEKIITPNKLTEQEATNCIINVLGDAYYRPQKAFDSLPPLLQRLVGTPNQLKQWSLMDLDAVNSVIASNLARSYRSMEQSERTNNILGIESKKVGLLDG